MESDLPLSKEDENIVVEPKVSYFQYTFFIRNWQDPTGEKITMSVRNPETIIFPEHLQENDIGLKGFISVFNDVIEELIVIKCTLNEDAEENWNALLKYEVIQERFGSMKEVFHSFSNNKNMLRHVCIYYNIMSASMLEIVEHGSFCIMCESINNLFRLMHDETTLLLDTASNKALVQVLKNALGMERKTLNKIQERKGLNLFRLKEKLEDIRVYGSLEIKYTNNWEAARHHQRIQKLKQKEDYYINMNHEADENMSMESRINTEIRKYLAERTVDLQNGIEYWMERYDKETEDRDSEILKLKMDIEIQKEHIEKEHVEYEERTKFVEERLKYNEERRLAIERAKIELWATLKIQAWWRGVMVRKKLGPYRKKRKKGKGKGKDNKKNKKK